MGRTFLYFKYKYFWEEKIVKTWESGSRRWEEWEEAHKVTEIEGLGQDKLQNENIVKS